MKDDPGKCMKVGLFVTCLVDLMRPEIGLSTVKLLEFAGCEVIVPSTQTCCGQPAYSAGNRAAARELAEKFLSEFEHCDYVVIPSGSCGGTIKIHYDDLFADAPNLRERMARLASRVFELTDFLHSILHVQALPARRADSFRGTLTYHDSCSGLRELGVERQPRALLEKIPGLTLKEMKDCRACCGFGGAFAVKYGDISTAIVDEKCTHIHESEADAVVMGDLGCMLHVEGRLRRTGDCKTRVLHIAQILAGDT